jgi:hypothetical protein
MLVKQNNIFYVTYSMWATLRALQILVVEIDSWQQKVAANLSQ